MRYSDFWTFLLIAAFGPVSYYPGLVQAAGPYLDSAHGNSTYGVSRVDIAAAGFVRGNCAHCHDQHASVGAGSADLYMLFDKSNTDQARNLCLNCHGSGTVYQTGGHVINRSYSFRAGGWTADPLNNVKDAFSSLSQASSHNLNDIVKFAGATARSWKYNSIDTGNANRGDSNACGVCHDPHLIQGDPAFYAFNQNSPKSAAARTGVVTQINSSPVNLWGDKFLPDLATDNPVERMSSYPTYRDPYRSTVTPTFEPDGNSAQQGGANSVNYVAFCTTCHNDTNAIYSSDLFRQLNVIDWPLVEKHGQEFADDDIQMNGPYSSGNGSLGYVLSCLDCHEPHGAVNVFLIRGKVNGGVTTSANPSFSTSIISGNEFGQLCSQCHNPRPLGSGRDWEDVHHDNTVVDGPYLKVPGSCNVPAGGCHANAAGPPVGVQINCYGCHYHGAVTGGTNPVTLGTIPMPDLVIGLNPQTF